MGGSSLPPWLTLVMAVSVPVETFILAGVLWLLKLAASDRAEIIAEFRSVRDIVRDHDSWIRTHDRWAVDRVDEIKGVAYRLEALVRDRTP